MACLQRSLTTPSIAWRLHLNDFKRASFACRYILTKGPQFGADWLVYQGSPETHHAAACLRIVDPNHPIDPVLLAGFCRCSFSARKDVLLASWDRQLNAPHFLTLRPKARNP